jgi:hypothetical protein
MLLTTAEITPATAAAVMMDLNEVSLLFIFVLKITIYIYGYNSYR